MIPAGLLLVLMGACCYAQYYPFGYFGYRPFLGGYFPQRDEPHSLFRSGSADLLAVDSPSPSFDSKLEVASRAWAIFTTITFTVSFSTTTATITTYTICTTSTSFVSTCTAGRRRRHEIAISKGEVISDRVQRLMYDEENEDLVDHISAAIKIDEDEKERVRRRTEPEILPTLMIQPSGFRSGGSFPGSGRFWALAATTSTATVYTLTTSTITLSATCWSITSYSTCNPSGK